MYYSFMSRTRAGTVTTNQRHPQRVCSLSRTNTSSGGQATANRAYAAGAAEPIGQHLYTPPAAESPSSSTGIFGQGRPDCAASLDHSAYSTSTSRHSACSPYPPSSSANEFPSWPTAEEAGSRTVSDPLSGARHGLTHEGSEDAPFKQAYMRVAGMLLACAVASGHLAPAAESSAFPQGSDEAVLGGSPLAEGLADVLRAAQGLPVESHYGSRAVLRSFDTIYGWIMSAVNPLREADPTTYTHLQDSLTTLRGVMHIAFAQIPPADRAPMFQAMTQAFGSANAALEAFFSGLKGDLSALTSAPESIWNALDGVTPVQGASGFDAAAVALAVAVVVLLITASTPDDDFDTMRSSELDYLDSNLLKSSIYSPAINEQYWARRPVRVIQQVSLLVAEVARLAASFLSDSIQDKHTQNSFRRARELRSAIERLGPAYIKFAQVLSTRIDLVPEVYVAEIIKLQDNVAPFETELAYEVMSQAWKVPPYIVCDRIDARPVASASLGQVYRAQLNRKYGGKDVAIKVLRPGILEAVALDIYIMRFIAGVVGNNSKEGLGKAREWVEVIDEWAVSFFEEVDFLKEMNNMIAFQEQMKDVKGITVPDAYPDLSTSEVLVTGWVDGLKLENTRPDRMRQQIGALLNAYLIQLLEPGNLLHCDPHPGNLLLTRNGTTCILDYGLMTRVTEEQQLVLVEFLAHLACEDWDMLMIDLKALGFIPAGVDVYQTGLISPVIRIFSQITSPTAVRRANIDMIMSELADLSSNYPFRIPPLFVLILRTFSIIEGLGLRGSPQFSIVQECFPYIARRMLTDDSPRSQELLRQVLFGKKRHLDVARLGRLADALQRYTVTDPRRADVVAVPVSPADRIASTGAATAAGTSISGVDKEAVAVGASQGGPWNLEAVPDLVFSGRGVDVAGFLYAALTGQPNQALLGESERELLLLIFRKNGTFLQEILAEELVAAVDALYRQNVDRLLRVLLQNTTANAALSTVETLAPLQLAMTPVLAPLAVLERLEPLFAPSEEDRDSLALIAFLEDQLRDVRSRLPWSRSDAFVQLPLDPTIPLTGAKLAGEVAPLIPQILPGVVHLSEHARSEGFALLSTRLALALDILSNRQQPPPASNPTRTGSPVPNQTSVPMRRPVPRRLPSGT